MEIIAQVEGHQELSGTRLLEVATRKRLPAVVVRVLMRVTAGRVPVRLMSIRSEPVTLYKEIKIATIEGIEVWCSNNRTTQTASNNRLAGICASKAELLYKMAADAGVDLSEDERQRFFNLVCTYADIFAGSTSDQGRTNKFKHCIDTGTTPLIRQPVRRIPPQRRGEVPQIIDDMLSKAIVGKAIVGFAHTAGVEEGRHDQALCRLSKDQ